MTVGAQTAFYDFPAEMYPITVVALRASDGREVWRATVDEPGALVVPALAKTFGRVQIRIEWGDGTVTEPDE